MTRENDEEFMDDLEAEMDRDIDSDGIDMLSAAMDNSAMVTTNAGSSKAAASSSLPSHMIHHAAEFWFPECRDCSCCKGFKHGCPCGGLCVCSGGCDNRGSADNRVNSHNHQSSNVARPSNSGGNLGGSTKAPCRFYQMGTCKFGNNCRFSHS